MKRPILIIVAVVATGSVAAGIVACGTTTEGSKISKPRLELQSLGSRVETFETMDELVGASQMVVTGHATAYSVEYVGTAPNYITDFVVERVVVADSKITVRAGDTLKIRDVLGTTGAKGKEAPLFMVKTDFLLFLSPFYFERGVDIGEWIPTGNPAGIYIDLNPGSDEFSKLDPESPALPEVIGTEQQQEISHLTSLIATAERAR